MTPRNARRRRLAAALVGFGLAGSVGAIALPSPAAAIPLDPPCPGSSSYTIQADYGRVLAPTEPTQIVYNGNPSPVPVSFTSTQSSTVSSTASWSVSISGGISIGIVNSSVSATYGVSTMNSATTSIGVTVGPMMVPPGHYQLGEYGVWRRKTSGDYFSYTRCILGHSPPNGPITAYSVTGVGWDVWQEQG